MFLLIVCSLFLGSFAVEAAPSEDEIQHLPGLHNQPSFRHYSGYLHVEGGKHLHYWFVESQKDPRSSPVILWLNGGPGCSSLDGLLTEHGPYLVQSDGSTLEYNPYSWNKITNVIYLESPVGVGFSYSDDNNYVTNDTEVTQVNYLALKEFFSLFSEFRENDFYIMGESYGGIYVPTLAVKVSQDPSINLKGIAVGNGISSYDMDFNSELYFLYYHGIMDTELFLKLQSCCLKDRNCDLDKYTSLTCWFSLLKAKRSSRGLNMYNIYKSCAQETTENIREKDDHITMYKSGFLYRDFDSHFREKLKGGMPCIDSTAATTYLNTPKVRLSLHITSKASPWELCNDNVFRKYGREVSSVEKQYLELLKKKFRILNYSGDVDMACNFMGNDWFVDSLNLELQDSHRPWFYHEGDQEQIGGFVRQFTNLTILTIKGAGHMAPADKPDAVYAMFSRFIQNKPI
ncbi:lysosomal protective protein-like isoform 2-T2 [Discoglossus pictus]